MQAPASAPICHVLSAAVCVCRRGRASTSRTAADRSELLLPRGARWLSRRLLSLRPPRVPRPTRPLLQLLAPARRLVSRRRRPRPALPLRARRLSRLRREARSARPRRRPKPRARRRRPMALTATRMRMRVLRRMRTPRRALRSRCVRQDASLRDRSMGHVAEACACHELTTHRRRSDASRTSSPRSAPGRSASVRSAPTLTMSASTRSPRSTPRVIGRIARSRRCQSTCSTASSPTAA